MKKLKNNLIMLLYTVIIGSLTGLIIWAFLKIMNLGIMFFWDYLPKQLNFKYYPILICLIGGLLLGLWKSKFGDSPEELEEVLKEVKTKKRYPYKNIKSSIVSALFPLVLGASVGPEAGLTGIIAGLCTWVGDKLKKFHKEMKGLTEIGITATLGTIFSSPLFGFVEPLESDKDTTLPKQSKIILYFTAILSSFGTLILFNKLFKGSGGIPTISGINLDNFNYLYIPLLIIIGVLLGYLFFISENITKKIFVPINNMIVKCTIGGLILGVIGNYLPLTMFSGEEQIETILETGTNIGVTTLILISIIKIVLTNICIKSGLKGGHFFPMIFAGITFGYAMGILLNINVAISMAIVTTSFLAFILKKPLATVLLLMIVFDKELIPIMLLSAIISCIFPKLKTID